jgi:hypothetical protein
MACVYDGPGDFFFVTRPLYLLAVGNLIELFTSAALLAPLGLTADLTVRSKFLRLVRSQYL